MERGLIQSEITHTSSSTTLYLGSCWDSGGKIILCCLGFQPQAFESNQQGSALAKTNFTGGCHSFTGSAARIRCIVAVEHQTSRLASFHFNLGGREDRFGINALLIHIHPRYCKRTPTHIVQYELGNTLQKRSWRGNRGGSPYLYSVYTVIVGNSPNVFVLLPPPTHVHFCHWKNSGCDQHAVV